MGTGASIRSQIWTAAVIGIEVYRIVTKLMTVEYIVCLSWKLSEKLSLTGEWQLQSLERVLPCQCRGIISAVAMPVQVFSFACRCSMWRYIVPFLMFYRVCVYTRYTRHHCTVLARQDHSHFLYPAIHATPSCHMRHPRHPSHTINLHP